MSKDIKNKIYGIAAEFDCPDALKKATQKVYEEGYETFESYSPFPIHGLAECRGKTKTRLPFMVLMGGMIGGCTGFAMQWFASVVHYPLNIGGKPLNSWPVFIPITFELAILGAALTAVFGMFALNGLPKPYHPVFNTDNFENVTNDRFFLIIQVKDKKYDVEKTKQLLESFSPIKISEVEE